MWNARSDLGHGAILAIVQEMNSQSKSNPFRTVHGYLIQCLANQKTLFG